MHITERCSGCCRCVLLCPQDAIHIRFEDKKYLAVIDNEQCLECGVCLDSGICPSGAIQESEQPRSEIRRLFGRMVSCKNAAQKESGRIGAWDVKTCDIDSHLPADSVIIRIELGRPRGGVTLVQAEGLRQNLLMHGYQPVNQKSYQKALDLTGRKELSGEAENFRVLSVCLEYLCKISDMAMLMTTAEEWSDRLCIQCRINALFSPDLLHDVHNVLAHNRWTTGFRCKLNLGLGRRQESDS